MADLDKKIKIIAVAGPTASGKTSLGIKLAKELDGEVVSCDSMQIYRSMQIATAAPTEAEMEGVPHHLIGIIDPSEQYSVVQYCADANRVIDDIVARGKLPVLVGGTGLYMNSLLDNITFLGSGAGDIRDRLIERAEAEGTQSLLDELASIDSEYASKLNPSDTKRIIRGLEIYYNDGVTMSEQLARSHETPSRFDTIKIGITFDDRELLYNRINHRVDLMFEQGLLEEARTTYEGASPTAAQAIGHKELFDYFNGTATLEQCVEHLKMQTRRYAKRQLSWLRRDSEINWLSADKMNSIELFEKALEIIRGEWQH